MGLGWTHQNEFKVKSICINQEWGQWVQMGAKLAHGLSHEKCTLEHIHKKTTHTQFFINLLETNGIAIKMTWQHWIGFFFKNYF